MTPQAILSQIIGWGMGGGVGDSIASVFLSDTTGTTVGLFGGGGRGCW